MDFLEKGCSGPWSMLGVGINNVKPSVSATSVRLTTEGRNV